MIQHLREIRKEQQEGEDLRREQEAEARLAERAKVVITMPTIRAKPIPVTVEQTDLFSGWSSQEEAGAATGSLLNTLPTPNQTQKPAEPAL
jgi:hypothetical protein